MPKGHYFSQEVKELMFNVLEFIEAEKNGPTIPLYNVNDRIMAALQISHGSMAKLKNEMKELQEEQQKIIKQKLLEQQQKNQPYALAQRHKAERLRQRSSSPYATSKNDHSMNVDVARSVAKSPSKRGGPSNFKISLSEYEEDLISEIRVPMDSMVLMAQQASYFRKLDEIRQNGTMIYYHDETWINTGEEKRSIWVNEYGEGRIRISQGKGARLAVSVLINENGFHHSSIDMFKCDQENSMDSEHFIHWIGQTCAKLRKEFEKTPAITIIIDNAPWHSELTDDTKQPLRSWRKQSIIDWLHDHNVSHAYDISKAELLQLAYENLTEKRYK
ncbi:unnamed protein product, partial [Rotaria sordida]